MKRSLKVLVVVLIILIAYYVYRKTTYITPFEIINYDNNYEIGLITTSAYSRNDLAYDKNVYRIIYDDQVYQREEDGSTSIPDTQNLALYNDQLIYENYGILVVYQNQVVTDNGEEVSGNTYGNYMQNIVNKSDNKIIFDAITEYRLYDTETGTVDVWDKQGADVHEIYYDVENQEIRGTLLNDGELMYITTTPTTSVETKLDIFSTPWWSENTSINRIMLGGEKLVVDQYVDLNEAISVYPIRVFDIETGELEKEIYPEFEQEETGYSATPTIVQAGDERFITITKNGYVQDINLNTSEVITYDVSSLQLSNEYRVELVYAEDDDSIYLVYSHLNDDDYITVYDVIEGKEIFKCEINKNEQVYGGIVVNNKNKKSI